MRYVLKHFRVLGVDIAFRFILSSNVPTFALYADKHSWCFCSDHLKNGEELCIRVYFSFFVFISKLDTTNNHRNKYNDVLLMRH